MKEPKVITTIDTAMTTFTHVIMITAGRITTTQEAPTVEIREMKIAVILPGITGMRGAIIIILIAGITGRKIMTETGISSSVQATGSEMPGMIGQTGMKEMTAATMITVTEVTAITVKMTGIEMIGTVLRALSVMTETVLRIMTMIMNGIIVKTAAIMVAGEIIQTTGQMLIRPQAITYSQTISEEAYKKSKSAKNI